LNQVIDVDGACLAHPRSHASGQLDKEGSSERDELVASTVPLGDPRL
jgi:hypothetical protein